VEKGKTLSDSVTNREWQDKVKTLLENYLLEFGLRSEATRTYWINCVIDDLATRAELVATEDILEEAVEQMRDLIEARVALVSNHDPLREHKEIAQIIVVLLNEKNADCLNKLFEPGRPDGESEVLERLRDQLATSMPIPVPEEVPLVMPVQAIELRSINPLRRLFGRST
jgi:hypothetical protein